MMNKLYVSGVGILTSGINNWGEARTLFAGTRTYEAAELPALKPELLAPAVRRRTGDYIRLAIEVATEAVKNSGMDGANMATVFATSEGDGTISDSMCRTVNETEPMISPTMFHNSVTNAPAGYWCIAVGSMKSSTSVAGWDGAFATGLIEAMTQVLAEDQDVVLVSHDAKLPKPLDFFRHLECDTGIALVLTKKQQDQSIAAISLELIHGEYAETPMTDISLEHLRCSNPAARGLSVLQALDAASSSQASSSVVLPYMSQCGLQVNIEPC